MASATTPTTSAAPEQPWFLKTSFPVDFPTHPALYKPWAEFESIILDEIRRRNDGDLGAPRESSVLSDATAGEVGRDLEALRVESRGVSMSGDTPAPKAGETTASHPFMDALRLYGEDAKQQAGKEEEIPENMMRTANNDVAYSTTLVKVVDLFHQLEEVVTGSKLNQLLEEAWKEDPLMTLKIIFNARSIHIGKSSRNVFYRCAGWLAENHPETLIGNLRWLVRPVIEIKVQKEGNEMVVVEAPKEDDDPTRFDVRNGGSHGYWKDLLNLVTLAVSYEFGADSDPLNVLRFPNETKPQATRGRSSGKRGGAKFHAPRPVPTRKMREAGEPQGPGKAQARIKPRRGTSQALAQAEARELRHKTRDNHHEHAMDEFNEDPVYRALHLTVARLFAEQLEKDLAALRGNEPRAKRNISLCGKWAPSQNRFHDKTTFIVSTIAEILHPRDSFDALSPTDTRETYLRYAREEYRKDTSALRKRLEVVERDITEENFKKIRYDRVPSIAMKNYNKLFIRKDLDGFEKYIDKVAAGKAKISGAVLLPSALIKAVGEDGFAGEITEEQKKNMAPQALIQHKIKSIESKVLDGQWNTLVQRIKDSGSLENSIAVCDVSGSMYSPTLSDGTTPLHSSIGLSLLISEVTKPPFGGAFICFSEKPSVQTVDLKATFAEKVRRMYDQPMGFSTNFVSVFKDLILPMAIKNKLKQEDMVKRIFVFSDMHFNEADSNFSQAPWCVRRNLSEESKWNSSYERIKKQYEDAGYELPELVFWNLAGGAEGTAPAPVTATDTGTCLVSGYSQGMLKVFLQDGGFDNLEGEGEAAEENSDSEEEVVITKEGDGDEDVVVEQPPKKKAKIDPLAIVKKAVSHKSYEMLKVYD